MTLQEETQERIKRVIAGVPWVLRVTTGEITPEADNVSTDEIVHGVQLLAMELARIAIDLAGELDKLRSTE